MNIISFSFSTKFERYTFMVSLYGHIPVTQILCSLGLQSSISWIFSFL